VFDDKRERTDRGRRYVLWPLGRAERDALGLEGALTFRLFRS
jgi:hypothetical protein